MSTLTKPHLQNQSVDKRSGGARKIGAVLKSFDDDLAFRYGKVKFLIYSLWPTIVDAEILSKTTIKKISCDQDGFFTIVLSPHNQSFGTKLRYITGQIEQKIMLNIKNCSGVRVVVGR